MFKQVPCVAVFLLSGRDLTTQKLSFLIKRYSYGDYFYDDDDGMHQY